MFVLALIPLSLILRKVKAGYEFSESKKKINHILFMDDLKLYSQSEKGLDSLVQTQACRNEKNSGGGLRIMKYCRPPWLADEENFPFQII